jgi:hypothetical protein
MKMQHKLTRVEGLLLTGCTSTSPGVQDIHLIALRTSNKQEVRLGYFGTLLSLSLDLANDKPL